MKLITGFIRIVMCVQLTTFGFAASALNPDGSGDKTGVQALYLFNETTGQVLDVSGVGTPLNLTLSTVAPVIVSDAFDRSNGLRFVLGAIAKSNSIDVSKVVNACKASNEITIEAWLLNKLEEPVDRPKPIKILTLAKGVFDSTGKLTGHDSLFYLGQDYDGGSQFTAAVRIGPDVDDMEKLTSAANSKGDGAKVFFQATQNRPAFQHVVFTKDKNNTARLWMSAADPSPTNPNPNGVLLPEAQSVFSSGDFNSWNGANMMLSFGNEPAYASQPFYVPGTNNINKEQKYWTGSLRMVAIYCKALTPFELVGTAAPGTTALPVIAINPNAPVTPELSKAQLLYKRIVGLTTPIDNPILQSMASLIGQGKTFEAAKVATDDHNFINITVRDMAARMSTRELTVNTTLNDMVATIMGVALNRSDARDLLTGNYSYIGDFNKVSARGNVISDFLLSNNHYSDLEKGRYDLASVLIRRDGQQLYNGATRSIVANPDPAGVITSRAFMESHAVAGTNRRLVEFTFRTFLCIPINQWADAAGTDTYVGRDVDRAPGGDQNKYKTTCRTCHSMMDSFRGAFAKVDFESGYVKNADVMFGAALRDITMPTDDPALMNQEPPGISFKMARNRDTFSGGYAVTTTQWINNANQGANALYFGWPAPTNGDATNKGSGVKSFATLVSQSKAFPRCMARRAYRSVCKRDADVNEEAMIQAAADEFAQNGYVLKDLFARVVSTTDCLGK